MDCRDCSVAISEDSSLFLRTHVGNLELPVTPSPGDLMSSGICGFGHLWHTFTHIYINSFKE